MAVRGQRERDAKVAARSGWWLPALLSVVLANGGVTVLTASPPSPSSGPLAAGANWQFAPLVPGSPTLAAAPPVPAFPVQLLLDDSSAEGTLGVNGVGSRQFMWFNRFANPGVAIDLQQIWVFFAPGPNLAVGGAVELAVFQDPDSNPANGANLLQSYNVTIQVVDGATFSVYSLTPALQITGPGDVLIGVIPRFITSNVTPAGTLPATLDLTASAGRSWLAVWSGDPPSPPAMNADSVLAPIGSVVPALDGNWLIRGFATVAPTLAIPTVPPAGLVLLAALLALAGAYYLRQSFTGDRGRYD